MKTSETTLNAPGVADKKEWQPLPLPKIPKIGPIEEILCILHETLPALKPLCPFHLPQAAKAYIECQYKLGHDFSLDERAILHDWCCDRKLLRGFGSDEDKDGYFAYEDGSILHNVGGRSEIIPPGRATSPAAFVAELLGHPGPKSPSDHERLAAAGLEIERLKAHVNVEDAASRLTYALCCGSWRNLPEETKGFYYQAAAAVLQTGDAQPRVSAVIEAAAKRAYARYWRDYPDSPNLEWDAACDEKTARQDAELLAAASRAFEVYLRPCGHDAVEWESMSEESRRVWVGVVQAVLKSAP